MAHLDHFAHLKVWNYSCWADLQWLLESLTAGPRPNRQLMRLYRMCADLIEEVCRNPAPLVAHLKQVLAAREPSYGQLHLRLTQFRRQALRSIHPSLQQTLQEKLQDTALGIADPPSTEMLLAMGEQLGYMSLHTKSLQQYYRDYVRQTFPRHFDFRIHSLDFIAQEPDLLFQVAQDQNGMARGLVCQGADVLLPLLPAELLKKVYLQAVRVGDLGLVEHLDTGYQPRIEPTEMVWLGHLELLAYLEARHPNLHQVPVHTQRLRLQEAAAEAQPELLRRLLELYPQPDGRDLLEDVIGSGSVACLEVWREFFGRPKITLALMDLVVSENCLRMAIELSRWKSSYRRQLVQMARTEGNSRMARQLSKAF